MTERQDIDQLVESWINGNCRSVMEVLKHSHPYVAAAFINAINAWDKNKILSKLSEDYDQFLLDSKSEE